MRFISLIYKNLARRRFRTVLTLLAFATAIAAVVSLLGIAKGFTQSFADVYESHSVDIVVSRQGSADRLSSSVNESFADEIATIPEVAKTAGVLLETMSLEANDVYGIPAMGVAPNSWLLDDYRFELSANAKTDEEGEDAHFVMLGTNLAQRVGITAGEAVMIFEEPYCVSRIFTSQSIWENGSMIFPLSQLQSLTDRTGQVTYINVVLDKPVSSEKAARAVSNIQAIDAKLHALATDDFVETDTRMRVASAMAWMTSMIALVIGAIGTLNTMMMSVLERTREIGILRAMGWQRRRVVAMIMLESCTMALVASIMGSLLAMLLTWGLSRFSTARGILSPAIDGQVLAQGVAIALVIGLLGAFIPAWRASRMLPSDAFRES
jgi:putative ABC transport system permease protein